MNKQIKHTIPRYTSIDLPAFRFIPSQKTNSNKSLVHENIPSIPESSIDFSDSTWKNSQRYLYAIDLFNLGYYWEVHEVLEKIWLTIGKRTPTGIFIQGLIQLSVALLKKTESNSAGVKRMTAKSIQKLSTQKDIFIGIDISNLIRQFHSYINGEINTIPYISLHFE